MGDTWNSKSRKPCDRVTVRCPVTTAAVKRLLSSWLLWGGGFGRSPLGGPRLGCVVCLPSDDGGSCRGRGWTAPGLTDGAHRRRPRCRGCLGLGGDRQPTAALPGTSAVAWAFIRRALGGGQDSRWSGVQGGQAGADFCGFSSQQRLFCILLVTMESRRPTRPQGGGTAGKRLAARREAAT